MKEYIKCLKQYFRFSGRASRREFWMFTLINNLICQLLSLPVFFFTGQGSSAASIVFIALPIIYIIATLSPSIAVTIRRLHDINRSGKWILLMLIPVFNIIYSFIFLYFLVQPSIDGPSDFEDELDNQDDDPLHNPSNHIEAEQVSDPASENGHGSALVASDSSEDKHNDENDDENNFKKEKFSKKDDPILVGRPETLIVGYLEDITRKGLKDYIIGQTYKFFPSPHYTVYRIEKYHNGYLYEIHDGGNKVSHLKKIKEEFKNGENAIIIKTAGNYVKVAKNHSKVECMILQEHDDLDAKVIDAFDLNRMEEAVPLGAGVFLAGLMFISFGIILLFFSVLFKYGLYTSQGQEISNVSIEQMPHEYFETLPSSNERRYVGKMYLKNNQQWAREMVTVEREQNDPSPSEPERNAPIDMDADEPQPVPETMAEKAYREKRERQEQVPETPEHNTQKETGQSSISISDTIGSNSGSDFDRQNEQNSNNSDVDDVFKVEDESVDVEKRDVEKEIIDQEQINPDALEQRPE